LIWSGGGGLYARVRASGVYFFTRFSGLSVVPRI